MKAARLRPGDRFWLHSEQKREMAQVLNVERYDDELWLLVAVAPRDEEDDGIRDLELKAEDKVEMWP